MNDEGLANLVDAIVKQAANDYRQARRMLKRKSLTNEQLNHYNWLLADTERFFRSQWFGMMGGTLDMFKQLKRDCNRGDYRMVTKAWGDHIIRKPPRGEKHGINSSKG